LHRVEGRVLPGVALLEGSPVKSIEAETFRKWHRQDEKRQHGRPVEVSELKFDRAQRRNGRPRGKSVEERQRAEDVIAGQGRFY
jgi:hypothetical protein